MNYIKVFFALLVTSSLLFFSCGDDSNPGSSNNNNTGNINVSAGNGTKPQYSWSGGNVFSVTVVRTSDPTTPVWGIASPGSDAISSATTHGTTPAGAIQTFATETTLTAGVQYRVSVSRINGTDFGFTDFTP